MAFDYELQPGLRRAAPRYTPGQTEPLVSIVTPFYNGGEYFEQTFYCVVNQTFPWFEWILVDDGSTDEESIRKVEQLAATDSRARVVHKPNGGLASARNFGLAQAKTEYFLPIDNDDLIEPTYVECCWWMLQKNPEATWAYADSVGFGALEYVWNVPFNAQREKTENHLTSTAMIRRKALMDIGGYYAGEKHFNEDWHTWLRLMKEGGYPVQSCGEYLFWYRRKNQGELALVQTDPEIAARNRQLIEQAAAAVEDPRPGVFFPCAGVIALPALELPDYSHLCRVHEAPHITLLMADAGHGVTKEYYTSLLEDAKARGYEVSVLTVSGQDNSGTQSFRAITPEVFNLPYFMRPEDYAEFLYYYLVTRHTDILVFADYKAQPLKPWLQKMLPALSITEKVTQSELNLLCDAVNRHIEQLNRLQQRYEEFTQSKKRYDAYEEVLHRHQGNVDDHEKWLRDLEGRVYRMEHENISIRAQVKKLLKLLWHRLVRR